LGCTTSEVVNFIIFDEVFIEWHMFFLSEDCVIGFDVISRLATLGKANFSRMSVPLLVSKRRGRRYVVAWMSRRGFPKPKRMYSWTIVFGSLRILNSLSTDQNPAPKKKTRFKFNQRFSWDSRMRFMIYQAQVVGSV
jgi:hypothetical protein